VSPAFVARCPCSLRVSGTGSRQSRATPSRRCMHSPPKFTKWSRSCRVLIAAQMNLSTMLQQGDGCTRDLTEFKRWYVRAPPPPGSVRSSVAPPLLANKAR
jgi:hypothetical protein